MKYELGDSEEADRLTIRPKEPPPVERRPEVMPEPRPLAEILVDARLILCCAYLDKFAERGWDNAYAICRALNFKPQQIVDARSILLYRKNK